LNTFFEPCYGKKKKRKKSGVGRGDFSMLVEPGQRIMGSTFERRT
jgi:hypothetical protein